jgi:hypothetical protein
VGRGGASHAVRATGLLHRLPQTGRVVRRLGGGLSACVHQSECAEEARPARHRAAVGAGRASPLRAYHRAALRSGEPAAARHAQGCQRGFGSPRPGNDWRNQRPALAAEPPGLLHRAAAERTLGARHGQHGEDLIRASGRCRRGLQSPPAGPALARLSHLYAGEPQTGAAGRCTAW